MYFIFTVIFWLVALAAAILVTERNWKSQSNDNNWMEIRLSFCGWTKKKERKDERRNKGRGRHTHLHSDTHRVPTIAQYLIRLFSIVMSSVLTGFFWYPLVSQDYKSVPGSWHRSSHVCMDDQQLPMLHASLDTYFVPGKGKILYNLAMNLILSLLVEGSVGMAS